ARGDEAVRVAQLLQARDLALRRSELAAMGEPLRVEPAVDEEVPHEPLAERLLGERLVDRPLVAPAALEVVVHEAHRGREELVVDVAVPPEPAGDVEEAPADCERYPREREQRRAAGVHSGRLIDGRWVEEAKPAQAAYGVEEVALLVARRLGPGAGVANLHDFAVALGRRGGAAESKRQIEPAEGHRP